MTEEETYQSFGFTDSDEFFNLVSNADMSTPAKISAFKLWQAMDGTKTGLLKLAAQ